MCRLVGWVSDRPRTLSDVLGPIAVERFAELSTVHANGWGAAWSPAPGASVEIRRSMLEADTDPDFADFATTTAATSAVVHLRLATPGMGYTIEDNHPFRDGAWTMAHNGAILPAAATGGLMRADSTRTPRGGTDSERYFYALRDEMDRDGVNLPEAVGRVVARMAEAGLQALSLNAMLLEPGALHVVSCHDPDRQPVGVQVWPSRDVSPPPYFDVWWTEKPGIVVAASSGIVESSSQWRPMSPSTVLSVDSDTLGVTVDPIGRVLTG
ncbi:MAG: class II glutamine amidotransferase [Nocardioidaceae bacterium]